MKIDKKARARIVKAAVQMAKPAAPISEKFRARAEKP